MPYLIDHVVIGVTDLTAATADFTRAGFTVTPGGEHSSGNTHNALITFADGAYLELIAFKDGVINPDHKWGPRLARGEGFLDYCLTGPALAPEAGRLTAAGLAPRGPQPLGRFRPDGQRLEWQSIVFARDEVPLPFIIEDLTPRALRVPGGETSAHAVLARALQGIRVLVASLATAIPVYSALLDVPAADIAAPVRGAGAAARFALGAQWIELIEPEPGATELLDYQRERGAAPYEIVLSSERPPGLLAQRFTRQARIRLGQGG